MGAVSSEIESGAFIHLMSHNFTKGCLLVAIPVYGLLGYPDKMQLQCQTHDKVVLVLEKGERP